MENLVRSILENYYEGEKLEKQIKRHMKVENRYVSSIAKWINKYGFDIAKNKFDEYYKNAKIRNTLEGYIQRYGKEKGTELYYEKNSRLSVGVNALRKNGYSEDEIKTIREKHSKNSEISKDSFIKKFGEIDGKQRWEEHLKTIRFSSKRCVEYWITRGYTLVEAQNKVSKSQKRDLQFFLERGWSEEQYLELNKKRTNGWFTDESIKKRHSATNSKIQFEFTQELFEKCSEEIRTKFVGQPITKHCGLIRFNDEQRSYCCPDIFIDDFIIIEFDGSYWHSKIKERDEYTTSLLTDLGYSIIRVVDLDYIENKEKTLQKVIDFIGTEYESKKHQEKD
jgi:hypothetical protein